MAEIAKLYGARILLVEDNVVNQQLFKALMDVNNIDVEIAANGKEALIKLEQEPFDGVLMDCQMPVMDGYEATRQLRMNKAFKDLPIIAITANAMAHDRQKVLDVGMNDYVTKPIDFDEVLSTMAKWIIPAVTQHPEAENKQTGGSTVRSGLPRVSEALQIDQPRLNTCLQHLDNLLQNFDTEAIDVTIELTALLGDIEEIDLLASLTQSVNDFDFEKAHEQLKLLKGSLS